METVELQRNVQQEVIVLNLSYNLGFAWNAHSKDPLSELLVNSYNDGEGGPSCVIVIDGARWSGFTIRGLCALYEAVRKHNGRLICVKPPEDSVEIESLMTSGMTSLEGFSLSNSLEEALQALNTL